MTIWRLNNMLLRKPMGQQGNQRSEKISQDRWKWKYHLTKSMSCSKRNSKMEVHSDIDLPQETRKITEDHKRPRIAKAILRKKTKLKVQIFQTSDSTTKYSTENSMVLAQKQTCINGAVYRAGRKKGQSESTWNALLFSSIDSMKEKSLVPDIGCRLHWITTL